MFDDWSDEEWSKNDNYMVSNLQAFLEKGFVKSKFKNLLTRKFISETSHEFFEWIQDEENEFGKINRKHIKKSIYDHFIMEHPDYGPRGKITVIRKRFYKWLDLYGEFKFKAKPEKGRESSGHWIKFVQSQAKQTKMRM